jgi:hypothetical protein
MVRGERPIKLADSWHSAKTIKVERLKLNIISIALDLRSDPI